MPMQRESKYTIMLKDSQKKAKRANVPISNDVFIAIATKSLMEANTFPDETKDWGKRSLNQKSWLKWKAHHLLAHKSCELHIRACGGKEPFNGANAAAELPANSKHNTAPPDDATMDCLYDYLNNTTNEATNEKAVHKQLVATNAKQKATIDTQATTIKSLTGQVRTLNEQVLSLKSKAGGRGGHNDRTNWVKNGYCWSHGYGVGPNHNSLSCTKRAECHKEKADRRNIMAGKFWNKGWDM